VSTLSCDRWLLLVQRRNWCKPRTSNNWCKPRTSNNVTTHCDGIMHVCNVTRTRGEFCHGLVKTVQNVRQQTHGSHSLLKTVLDSVAVFKSRLKTFLLSHAFSPSSSHQHTTWRTFTTVSHHCILNWFFSQMSYLYHQTSAAQLVCRPIVHILTIDRDDIITI